jgi:hypothetical protein
MLMVLAGTDVAFMLPNDERSEAVMAESHGLLLEQSDLGDLHRTSRPQMAG